jgi:hypothetical protein
MFNPFKSNTKPSHDFDAEEREHASAWLTAFDAVASQYGIDPDVIASDGSMKHLFGLMIQNEMNAQGWA